MKYANLCRYVADTPWAIHPSKLAEIVSTLAFKAAGGDFTAEEIRARLGDDRQSPPATSKHGAVAILPIRGTITHRGGGLEDASGAMSAEKLSAMLRQVVADESVGTIVLDVDSPGGTVTGMQELAAEIFAARESKHIIAVTNGLNASAAYWLSSQAHEIVSIPSGVTGSIGVFTAHQDLSKALEQEGIKVTLISAGKHKTEGNPFEPLSDEAQTFIQGRVDAAYGQFVKDVARGRGVSVADVRGGFGEGRALDAKAAKAAGLIDRIDTMDGVIGKLVGRKAASGMRADGSYHVAFTNDERVTDAETSETELSEPQREFVATMAEMVGVPFAGNPAHGAAELAGYADPVAAAEYLLAMPKIQKAIETAYNDLELRRKMERY